MNQLNGDGADELTHASRRGGIPKDPDYIDTSLLDGFGEFDIDAFRFVDVEPPQADEALTPWGVSSSESRLTRTDLEKGMEDARQATARQAETWVEGMSMEEIYKDMDVWAKDPNSFWFGVEKLESASGGVKSGKEEDGADEMGETARGWDEDGFWGNLEEEVRGDEHTILGVRGAEPSGSNKTGQPSGLKTSDQHAAASQDTGVAAPYHEFYATHKDLVHAGDIEERMSSTGVAEYRCFCPLGETPLHWVSLRVRHLHRGDVEV